MGEGRRTRTPPRLLAAVFVFAAAALHQFFPAAAFSELETLRFEEGYSNLFGGSNLQRFDDDRTVRLVLDRHTGSGFISSDLYDHGFFSAKIKLPSNYTAGVVVAFYTSNGDIFKRNHDELDFEFLGCARSGSWKLQTNIYGNGSTQRGREERYLLPFDPSLEAHRYSIFWSPDTIIFYVDETPIREVRRSAAMGGEYPSKPMALYATIWDGSSWATSGGRYAVDYKFAPFVSEFSELVLAGCRVDPIEMLPGARDRCAAAEAALLAADYAAVSAAGRRAMARFREKNIVYSACYDSLRYPVRLPDCDFVPAEKDRLDETGHLKRALRRRRRRRPSHGDI
ncbi:putative xyloglucan endotransglucosylase/hydrolase protein 30 [Wolffia australiana]